APAVSALYNFGSTDDCPCEVRTAFPNPGPPCAGWNVEQLYQMSWGLGAEPFPQIYRPIWARWWNVVKRWGYDHHQGALMKFRAPMCCSRTGLSTPDAAWRTLWLELNSDDFPLSGINPLWTTSIANSLTHVPSPTPTRTPTPVP